jgi:DNA recombination protein RmuC
MPEWSLWALLLINTLILILLLWMLLRRTDEGPLQRLSDELGRTFRADGERVERELRDELGRQALAHRQDLGSFQTMLLAQSGDVARTQNEQIDSFRTQLAAMQQAVGAALAQATQSLATQSLAARESQDAALRRFGESMAQQLGQLSEANERRMTEMRAAVEARLAALQEGNEKKLEQMRATVDEKLHATLEQRLGESFKQVADRLDQVHKGLGEMQTLARDVGSLSRVLNNVKTRGIYGEVQLAGLLEQVFTLEQYATNVVTVPGSNERVEFAIRLPGQRADGVPLWLPIDAKFPREDYERLLDAHERADAPRPRPSRPGYGWRRAASATSTSRRRTPPISRSCSSPPRGFMPRPCGGQGWWSRCSASSRSCSPGRRPFWPRSTACRWVSARWPWRSGRPRCGRCWAL